MLQLHDFLSRQTVRRDQRRTGVEADPWVVGDEGVAGEARIEPHVVHFK